MAKPRTEEDRPPVIPRVPPPLKPDLLPPLPGAKPTQSDPEPPPPQADAAVSGPNKVAHASADRQIAKEQQVWVHLVHKCDHEHLRYLLAGVIEARDRDDVSLLVHGKKSSGLRKLPSILKRLRGAVTDLEYLNGIMAWHTSWSAAPKAGLNPARGALELSRDLHNLADFIEKFRPQDAARTKLAYTHAKARLVAYVIHAHKTECDKQVAPLLAGITEKKRYDDLAHKKWRSNHANEIRQQLRLLPPRHSAPAVPEEK